MLLTLLAGLIVACIMFLLWKRLFVPSEVSACVLVLGDFGRSPRMQYHTLSLAQTLPRVDVLAYCGLP